jgi:carbohydrate diacid regulator
LLFALNLKKFCVLIEFFYKKRYNQPIKIFSGIKMDADIRIFINGIRERTGIELSVFGADGNFIAGNGDEKQVVPTEIEDILVDQKNNRTLFLIKYKSKCFIGMISGADETAKNYAYLIGELAENSFFKESGLSRRDFVKAILFGEANYTQVNRYMRKYSMKDTPAFVMVISVDKERLDGVKEVLLNFSSEDSDFVIVTPESRLAFVKFMDEDGDGYQSSTEYAEFLRQSIYEETGALVKISVGGTVNTIIDLSTSFSQAVTASRMAETIESRGDVHSYKEFVLIKMLEDLPKYKLNEYLEILMDSGAREIFADPEMVATAEEFLENSLNVCETARKLYLHRNTLIYRLDKIERATGLNIRKFSDALTFRMITIISKLIR